MPQGSEPAPPRRTFFDAIYDWLNNCDLAQLDAIMVAMFVFIAGCGLIVSLYIAQHFENFLHNLVGNAHRHTASARSLRNRYSQASYSTRPYSRAYQAQVQAYPTSMYVMPGSTLYYLPQTTASMPAGSTVRFGKPRTEPDAWHQPPAQAEAATGYSY